MFSQPTLDIVVLNFGKKKSRYWLLIMGRDLWNGGGGFSGFKNLSKLYNKPLFIGEYGWHQTNNSINAALPGNKFWVTNFLTFLIDWFNQIYQSLVTNIDNGCIGGAFFEYSDEKEKGDEQERTMVIIFGNEYLIIRVLSI